MTSLAVHPIKDERSRSIIVSILETDLRLRLFSSLLSFGCSKLFDSLFHFGASC